jgi:predicted Zn-dependent peptidase
MEFSSFEDVKISRLSTGALLATERVGHLRSAAITFWLCAGSRYESEEEQGISHLLEHLVFKGTHKRTAREISETIEGVGGELNAFTMREHTCYLGLVLAEHVPLAAELLADMIQHPLLESEAIEVEKSVVLEEIQRRDDTPESLLDDLLPNVVWNGHPLGRSVLGTTETVRALSRDALERHLHALYTPERLVVTAAGDVDHEQLAGVLESNLRPGEKLPCGSQNPAPPSLHPQRRFFHRSTEGAHLAAVTRGLPYGDRDQFVLSIIEIILGVGASSRLYDEVREKRGLAYSIYSHSSPYTDAGLFGVYVATSLKNMDIVLELVKKELARLREEGASDQEMERAKMQLKAGLLRGLESTYMRADHMGESLLTVGRIPTLSEMLAQINLAGAEDVKRLAGELLKEELLSVIAVGPFETTC